MATRTKGPWNHRKCAEHRKVEGYTAKVCVLPGQNGDEVEHFAAVMYRLAKHSICTIYAGVTHRSPVWGNCAMVTGA
jgi:hypothetical protein